MTNFKGLTNRSNDTHRFILNSREKKKFERLVSDACEQRKTSVDLSGEIISTFLYSLKT